MSNLLGKAAPVLSKNKAMREYFKELNLGDTLNINILISIAELENYVVEREFDEEFWEKYKYETDWDYEFDKYYELLHWVAPELAKEEEIIDSYLKVSKRWGVNIDYLKKVAKLEKEILRWN